MTSILNVFKSSHVLSLSTPLSGSMLPLDLAEGVSVFSKGLSCQLIVSFNKDPSQIHDGLVIDSPAPTDAYKNLYVLKAFWMTHTGREKEEEVGGREGVK